MGGGRDGGGGRGGKGRRGGEKGRVGWGSRQIGHQKDAISEPLVKDSRTVKHVNTSGQLTDTHSDRQTFSSHLIILCNAVNDSH